MPDVVVETENYPAEGEVPEGEVPEGEVPERGAGAASDTAAGEGDQVSPAEEVVNELASVEPPAVSPIAAPIYYKPDEPAVVAALQFQSAPLRQRIFLNSVPKCGTMLLRNVILMFTGVAEFYEPMLSTTNMDPLLNCQDAKFFYGHVNCTPDSRAILAKFKHVVLVRDPYDYVAAYARFFYSEQLSMESKLGQYVNNYELTFDDVVPFVINGWNLAGEDHPNIRDQFILNALMWLSDNVLLIRYEELMLHLKDLTSPESELYFSNILSFLLIDRPDDWRDRITAGADRSISSTSSEKIRENVLGVDRKVLNNFERNLVNIVAPNLRQILGYS